MFWIILKPRSNRVNAAIVLFGNAGNENAYISEPCHILDCPIVGGGAAFN